MRLAIYRLLVRLCDFLEGRCRWCRREYARGAAACGICGRRASLNSPGDSLRDTP